jgi:hypothetical protein
MLVIIPIESYDVLIGCCATSYPEYELLKNGFIMRNGEGEQEVRVSCDSAGLIVDFATEHCPEVVPYMRTASDAALWSEY